MQNTPNYLSTPESSRALTANLSPSAPSTSRKQPSFLPNDLPLSEYTRDDLISLLAYYEGELQARDVALSVVQADKTKKLLYSDGGNDATNAVLESLRGDSAVLPDGLHDSEMYIQLFSKQFRYLNQLAKTNKKSQRKFSEKLLETEDRHARELFAIKDKLEESERSIDRTKAGVCRVLEERIESLKAECARKQEELDRLDAEMSKREADVEAERERQKVIVLYMLSERKQLLALIHQLKTTMKDEPGGEGGNSNDPLVSELRRLLKQMCEERNALSHQCKALQAGKSSMLEVIRDLEDEVMTLRLGSMKTKQEMNNLSGYVMANKAAIAGEMPHENHTNTGTVRFNKWSKGGAHSLPMAGESGIPMAAKAFDHEHGFQQPPPYNRSTVQRPFNSIPSSTSSNLPRAGNGRSVHPAMGVRGSQLRNVPAPPARFPYNRTDVNHGQQSPSTHVGSSPLGDPPGYAAGGQRSPYSQTVTSIVYHPSNSSPTSDHHRVVTKRSTSLPRKTSNGEVVITTQKIISPVEDQMAAKVGKARPTRLAFPTHHQPQHSASGSSNPYQQPSSSSSSSLQRPQYYDVNKQHQMDHTHIS